MRTKLNRFNTLRNQMLFGFLFVMLIILSVVGIVNFDTVSRLLKNNAEKHIQQTAIQASGRLEAVLNQIDSLTTQVATNTYVQQVLLNESAGRHATFSERQSLLNSIKIVQTYADGVNSVELYSGSKRRLFPLDEGHLNSRISQKWIDNAREEKGRIVWIGIDPLDPNSVLAIRSVSLMDQWFRPGGYLLIRMNREIFQINEALNEDGGRETMLLADRNYSLIAVNDDQVTPWRIKSLVDTNDAVVAIDGQKYMLVKQQSALTGWTLLILTPISAITSGISVLRTAILVSAGIGSILFILLSFLLSTLITRPVFRLIKTMRSARLSGLKPTVQISSTIEINELNHSYNQMVEHMNELIGLVYEKEILQSRTELKALQAQIHPHFLFNTLEALYWSLMEKDEDELAEYVVAMADLFRYTITGPGKEEWVRLEDELEHIERYLLIMKMRLGDRLSWSISSPPALASVPMPKLLIQPLVENAILHGIEGRIGPGKVSVGVSLSADQMHLVVTVTDDGKGIDEDSLRRIVTALQTGRTPPFKGSGMGIFNVQQRIKLYYGGDRPDESGLAIDSQIHRGTRVSLTIPIQTGIQTGEM
ncbi:sensor histidine kinase [Paenibacillus sp. VMFN-D1]|uniref:sensor histidine kinase n=1 Tax=Paenibacillus sp. VMFN-D1 TaxID=2135608 RepID=UPI000E22169E|nr:sensor histidine kinase [Paenibacillus sp. VMFN-D1]RED36865.1 two-component system sensor histidine kinase YesM [Paenibacillus sp. VMFN-D1]